ncbi:MAG: hypothetical protein ACTSQI_22370, partial [Candidatus Helarchaeota archaeon]
PPRSQHAGAPRPPPQGTWNRMMQHSGIVVPSLPLQPPLYRHRQVPRSWEQAAFRTNSPPHRLSRRGIHRITCGYRAAGVFQALP